MEWYVLVLILSLPSSTQADCSSKCLQCAQQILNTDIPVNSLVRLALHHDTITLLLSNGNKQKVLFYVDVCLCIYDGVIFVIKNRGALSMLLQCAKARGPFQHHGERAWIVEASENCLQTNLPFSPNVLYRSLGAQINDKLRLNVFCSKQTKPYN